MFSVRSSRQPANLWLPGEWPLKRWVIVCAFQAITWGNIGTYTDFSVFLVACINVHTLINNNNNNIHSIPSFSDYKILGLFFFLGILTVCSWVGKNPGQQLHIDFCKQNCTNATKSNITSRSDIFTQKHVQAGQKTILEVFVCFAYNSQIFKNLQFKFSAFSRAKTIF